MAALFQPARSGLQVVRWPVDELASVSLDESRLHTDLVSGRAACEV